MADVADLIEEAESSDLKGGRRHVDFTYAWRFSLSACVVSTAEPVMGKVVIGEVGVGGGWGVVQ